MRNAIDPQQQFCGRLATEFQAGYQEYHVYIPDRVTAYFERALRSLQQWASRAEPILSSSPFLAAARGFVIDHSGH